MSFTANAARGFVSAFDSTQPQIRQYIEFCEATRRATIWICDETRLPTVFLDSSTCWTHFRLEAIDELAMLARLYDAGPECDLGDLCAFEFATLADAEAFAESAAEWLRQSGQFEPPKPIRQCIGPVVEYSVFFSRGSH